MFDIEGKVALVTGGAAGIGLEAVKELLKNGAKGVMIADVNVDACQAAIEELEQQFGKTRLGFVKTDVTNKQSFEGFLTMMLFLHRKASEQTMNALS